MLHRIFHKIFDKLTVVVCEEKQSSNAKNYQKEEKVYHKNISELMTEVYTEKVSAFRKEVKGKMFNISFVNNE